MAENPQQQQILVETFIDVLHQSGIFSSCGQSQIMQETSQEAVDLFTTNNSTNDIEETQKEVEDDNKTNVNLLSSLIDEIRKYPCIWNISSKAHKDKYKIAEAWRRLSAALQHPGKNNENDIYCQDFCCNVLKCS